MTARTCGTMRRVLLICMHDLNTQPELAVTTGTVRYSCFRRLAQKLCLEQDGTSICDTGSDGGERRKHLPLSTMI